MIVDVSAKMYLSLILAIITLIKTINEAGESVTPGRTPLATLNSVEVVDFHHTVTCNVKYQLTKIYISHLDEADLFSTHYSICIDG